MKREGRHIIWIRNSAYLVIPWYLREKYNIGKKDIVQYEETQNGIVIRIGDDKNGKQ
jgi:bifunctional DNA-binding transcriptional regulator/antitoxin component of YhaV-PrlF toxin-antitoxin module